MNRRSSQHSLSSPAELENCPLHLRHIQDAYSLPCGHAACEECLYAVASRSREQRRPDISCPVCGVVSPFEPERRGLEEELCRAERLGRSSRSSSVSSSIESTSHTVQMRRFAATKDDAIDVSASNLGVTHDAEVKRRVTLKLKLYKQNNKVLSPKYNTYVRGTICFPDNTKTEIDLLAVNGERQSATEDSLHSFEKVLVPDQVGKYKVEVSILGNINERIGADIFIKPSGGKVLNIRGSSKFKNPHDILVAGGQYIIADKGKNRIVVVDHLGNFQLEFGSKPPRGLKKIGPFALASDADSFYITDNRNKCVLQFLRRTGTLRVWSKVGPCPTGIAIDHEKIYVADAKECNIRVFNRHGDHLSTIGYPGSLEGALNYPWFMKVNSQGLLVVADRNNCRIQVFDPLSQKSTRVIPLDLGGKRWHCRGLTLDRVDNIYVTARRTDSWRGCSTETVMVFSSDGDVLGNFGEFREFDYLRGITIDEDMQMALVVDGANHTIKGYRL